MAAIALGFDLYQSRDAARPFVLTHRRWRGHIVLRETLLVLAIMIAARGFSGAGDDNAAAAEQVCLSPSRSTRWLSIALYPDALLANVLAASTYPLEVVQAERWLNEHKKLKDDALKSEVDKQGWDDSVKALASTPTVLSMMSDKLDWTKDLGDAVLAQQADVMDAIQRLRSKAHDNKKLTSTKEQKITVQQQDNKQIIVIEQTDPNTVYVPYYDPAVMYGEWPIPPTRHTISRRRPISVRVSLLPDLPSVQVLHWAAGAIIGAAAAIGATTTSSSTAQTTSTIGSTTRLTAKASDTTTQASNKNSATTTCGRAARTA